MCGLDHRHKKPKLAHSLRPTVHSGSAVQKRPVRRFDLALWRPLAGPRIFCTATCASFLNTPVFCDFYFGSALLSVIDEVIKSSVAFIPDPELRYHKSGSATASKMQLYIVEILQVFGRLHVSVSLALSRSIWIGLWCEDSTRINVIVPIVNAEGRVLRMSYELLDVTLPTTL